MHTDITCYYGIYAKHWDISKRRGYLTGYGQKPCVRTSKVYRQLSSILRAYPSYHCLGAIVAISKKTPQVVEHQRIHNILKRTMKSLDLEYLNQIRKYHVCLRARWANLANMML